MKNDIQGTVKPLAQFCRRQAEKENCENSHSDDTQIHKVKSITESLKNDSTADSVSNPFTPCYYVDIFI